MKLADVLVSTSFPLLGIEAASWPGPAFVGHVDRQHDRVRVVQLLYVDGIDASTMGVVVSTMDASAAREKGQGTIATHLVGFVSRFEPSYLMKRVKPRRFVAFAPSEFSRREMSLGVAGQTVGVELLTHRELPLQLARAALRVGDSVVEAGIGTWRIEVREAVARVRLVDVSFATQFDVAGLDAYPPPDWKPAE